jgi:hypothetical protein
MEKSDIGWAIDQLRAGEKVRRAGWNGKGMFLILVKGTSGVLLKPGSPYAKHLGEDVLQPIDSHIDMYTAQGTMQPGWLASQADLLATDWELA